MIQKTIFWTSWFKFDRLPMSFFGFRGRISNKNVMMDNLSHKRLKVLLGCYACDPYKGSEPGTGWNFAINISRYHDVHAIVEEGEFRANLERYCKENPDDVKNITFHYVPRKHHELLRKILPSSYYWFYNAWQRKAYKYAVELHKKENFDIVHHVNLVGYREPGYLWKLGKPFIWGPVGGFKNTPISLLWGLSARDFVHYICRNIINAYQMRFCLAARRVSKIAHTIFASDSLGADVIKRLWKRDTEEMREVGTHEEAHSPELAPHLKHEPLKLCWVGILEARKALPILLKAIPLCRQSVEVEVLGSGEKESEWKKLAHDLGIERCVHFHGHIPHSKVSSVMRSCHVMCITSIHEGGTPNIVMEAMQGGLPIVALNHCGYATAIDDTCGIKIPIQSQKKISECLARELDKLACDEELRMRMAQSAIMRARTYTWSGKMEKINRAYAAAVNK